LAEVLIALVIIGIVAAITVPTIISNVDERERSAKVKKAYSTLANAFTRLKADGIDNDYVAVNVNSENITNYLANYLVTTKVCYFKKGCWNSGNTRYLNGDIVYSNRNGMGIGGNPITAILNDGTFIDLEVFSSGSINKYFGVTVKKDTLAIFFDINGDKKPNVIGKDIFAAYWSDNGFVPAFKGKNQEAIEENCSNSGTGMACINKYLQK
jgi:type II secretory pathway pseudopilin PulG